MVEPLTVPKASGCSGSVMFGNLWIQCFKTSFCPFNYDIWQFHNFNMFPSTSEKVEFLMFLRGTLKNEGISVLAGWGPPPLQWSQWHFDRTTCHLLRWRHEGGIGGGCGLADWHPPCFFFGLLVSFSMEAPCCWYIDLQNWVILFGRMLINIPAPWSVWVMFY